MVARELALNLNKNSDISIFLKKEGKDISSQLVLEFTFANRKANIFNGNWLPKNHFWCVFINKIVSTAPLAPLTAFLQSG